MQTQSDIRQTINNTLLECLTNGGLPPWRKPWSNDPNAPGLHTSMSTGSPYRGINSLLLQVAAMKGGFQSKWWGTFNQIKSQKGASVKKSAKGTHVVLFKKIERERVDESSDEVKDNFFVMKTFTVFNADQTTGLDKYQVGFAKTQSNTTERYENADAVIDATGADIRHGGNEAYYNPSPGDFIQVPHRHQFDSPEAAYETTFHELTHWSEHITRLNWNRADEGYAMGELIAEISGCMMMAELGLPTGTNLQNHASYLKHWLDGMSGDPKFIFNAAPQASKAVDFLLSFSRTTADLTEAIDELVMV